MSLSAVSDAIEHGGVGGFSAIPERQKKVSVKLDPGFQERILPVTSSVSLSDRG